MGNIGLFDRVFFKRLQYPKKQEFSMFGEEYYCDSCEPLIIRDSRLVKRLLKEPQTIYVNAFCHQIKELFFIENKEFVGKKKEDVYASDEFKNYEKKKSKDFCHVYYPWSFILAKSVNKGDYLSLKTNRNQDLITLEEQEELRDLKIAIFGMSVGSNIAFVLTQAGISNEITIADLDNLDTTNLNRIWAGLHQIGLEKTIIAARRIYEDNPYAKVNVLRKGIDEDLLERFLKQRKIDIIVEEIDNMRLKIDTRRLAYKYKVPVFMITDNGDRVVLTIERYDLGYKKAFEKDFSFWTKRLGSYSGPKDFADIVINDIVGGPDKVDPRMLASAQRVVKRELISWPQLGSTALLGGIAVTIAIKKMLRKEDDELFTREHISLLE